MDVSPFEIREIVVVFMVVHLLPQTDSSCQDACTLAAVRKLHPKLIDTTASVSVGSMSICYMWYR
jgi:hypothetical protein